MKNVIEINSEMANALHKVTGENFEGSLLVSKEALENLTAAIEEEEVENNTDSGRAYNAGLADSIEKIALHLTPPGINAKKG